MTMTTHPSPSLTHSEDGPQQSESNTLIRVLQDTLISTFGRRRSMALRLLSSPSRRSMASSLSSSPSRRSIYCIHTIQYILVGALGIKLDAFCRTLLFALTPLLTFLSNLMPLAKCCYSFIRLLQLFRRRSRHYPEVIRIPKTRSWQYKHTLLCN